VLLRIRAAEWDAFAHAARQLAFAMKSSAPMVEIRWAQSTAEVQRAQRVRERVFCVEQGVPRSEEIDGLDDRALHALALRPKDQVIGTLRLLLVEDVAKIGRVAVERDWRRRGIASRMLDAALAVAQRRGCREARLASQLAATALYERAGFIVASEPFVEAGIAHVWMRRGLRSEEDARLLDP
jgi:predicted GNAT family N-acyltransferase